MDKSTEEKDLNIVSERDWKIYNQGRRDGRQKTLAGIKKTWLDKCNIKILRDIQEKEFNGKSEWVLNEANINELLEDIDKPDINVNFNANDFEDVD